jgi:hypothetical protein
MFNAASGSFFGGCFCLVRWLLLVPVLQARYLLPWVARKNHD